MENINKEDNQSLDDWKSEYLPRLEKSYIYASLEADFKESNDLNVIVLVENAIKFSINRAKTIIKHMEEYTLDDNIHLLRVLYIMERVITKDNIENLSIPEKNAINFKCFFP
ncbi:hypothetical protein [Elizabethkingia anophelis]|uniref:hypothetical protein n=1 Tax=Elizabethkingia anophelis TaxID=1117645 RepID=UPI0012B29CE5|nr:hypothetical protein [Elizabethkingia anophelis]QGN22329.1 hypothetical protein GJV56_06665 [Elizabethkingia anophelis]QNV08983.1 hypothetical protein EIY88_06645 [Elizabethkingia anophelis]UTF90738.1 hypothetical protein J2N93_06710 [Elizabethkingia anophelis]UTG01608.1 hypothetical protein J2O04_06710 [Elizabethkingia anophelis]UTG05358.1 hypothetical protein J2O03_06710 [Elizabethkingia anophelis]